MNKMLKNKKGFTLIELIVVIAIIGILAAVAVPRISGISDSARDRTDEANAKLLHNAVQMYYAEKGVFPASDVSDGGSPTDAQVNALVALLNEYLEAGSINFNTNTDVDFDTTGGTVTSVIYSN